jgi:hypothetical protein
VLKVAKVPQKIQGLIVAREAWWPMSEGVPDFIYFLDRPENAHLNYPLFARPAPVRPRHGFVESRVVRTHQELLALFERVKEVDPEGGLIVMRPIRADWNAIITPSGVVVGPGNDGATSGKGAYTIPSPSSLSWLPPGTLANAGVSTPYIEVVGERDEGGHIVQLRDGPPLAPGQDFIPREVRVEKVVVIRGDEDLLDWERACAVLRQEEGVVVYHPGGAVSSHYGVHCVLNGIPYVTSFEPKVGSRLKPTAYRWTRKDFAEVAERVPLYPHLPLRGKTTYGVPLAFAVVHSLGSFLSSPPNEAVYRLIAWALAVLVKASAMASVGELRYIPAAYRHKVPSDWEDLLWQCGDEGIEPVGRYDCYEGLEDWSLDEYGRALGIAYRLFAEVPWPSSYGGKPWAKSTKLALRLYQALRDFVEHPTRAKLRKAGEVANRLVNAVHNNGWYLDKLTDKRLLDIASDSPGYVIGVRGEVAAIVYEPFVKATDLPKVRIPRILTRGPVDLRDQEAVRHLLRKARLPHIERPEDNVFPGQVTLDFNDHAHLQVAMPRVNRDYGLAFDITREEPQALLLAAYWHDEVAKGTPPARSLNSSDPDTLRYFPVEVHVVGGKPRAVGVKGVWVALGGYY